MPASTGSTSDQAHLSKKLSTSYSANVDRADEVTKTTESYPRDETDSSSSDDTDAQLPPKLDLETATKDQMRLEIEKLRREIKFFCGGRRDFGQDATKIGQAIRGLASRFVQMRGHCLEKSPRKERRSEGK